MIFEEDLRARKQEAEKKTTYNLVTILQRPFFNLVHKINRYSDSFYVSKSVTKSRLHCTLNF